MMTNQEKKTKALICDLWWFIENVGDYDADRVSKFFALRERVRELTVTPLNSSVQESRARSMPEQASRIKLLEGRVGEATAALSRIQDILNGTFTPDDESYAEEAHGIAKGWAEILSKEIGSV